MGAETAPVQDHPTRIRSRSSRSFFAGISPAIASCRRIPSAAQCAQPRVAMLGHHHNLRYTASHNAIAPKTRAPRPKQTMVRATDGKARKSGCVKSVTICGFPAPQRQMPTRSPPEPRLPPLRGLPAPPLSPRETSRLGMAAQRQHQRGPDQHRHGIEPPSTDQYRGDPRE